MRQAGEEALLRAVETMPPALEQPGVWRLYQLGGGSLPMVAAVRLLPKQRPEKQSRGGPDTEPRVVCWGLVFPHPDQRWTVYTFSASAGAGGSETSIPDVPLPSGSRRSLALRDATGGAMIGFQGRAEPAVWMRHFNRWFESQGWQAESGWRSTGSTWGAKFGRGEAPVENAGSISVEFGDDGGGMLTGLLQMTPDSASPARAPLPPVNSVRGSR